MTISWSTAEKLPWARALGEVGGYVGQDIDAHHVGQAERAGAGPPDGRPGQRVGLFDGEALVQHQRRGGEGDGDTDPVGDEVGRVVGEDDLLAELAVGEGGKRGHDCRDRSRARE